MAIGLRRAGHEVLLASGGPLLEDIADEGVEVRTLPALGPEPEDHDIAHILWRRAAAMAPATVELVSGFRPELVVTDTITTVGFFVADLLGIPSIEVLPHHLVEPSPHIPPVGLGRAPVAGRGPFALWRRRDDAHIRRQQWQSVEQARRLRTEVRASIELPPPHGAVRRLVGAAPCLEYDRPDWPRDAVVVGPLVWEPDRWGTLHPVPGDEPVVVVTDTTASGTHERVAVRVLRALADAPVRVIATTDDPEAVALGDVTGNAVVGRGSHVQALSRASLAVGPCGGGFVGKAMSAGVPFLAVPGVGDQRETARRLEVAGVGRRVRGGPGFEARLRVAALRMLADRRFADRAAGCASACAGLGVPAAVREVEDVLTTV